MSAAPPPEVMGKIDDLTLDIRIRYGCDAALAREFAHKIISQRGGRKAQKNLRVRKQAQLDFERYRNQRTDIFG